MIASNYFLRWVLIVFIIALAAIIILGLVLALYHHGSTSEPLEYKEDLSSNYQEVAGFQGFWAQYRLYIYALLVTLGVGVVATASIVGLLS